MSVWVEEARWPRGKHICGHLLADSLEQLHAMAEGIGLARLHFNAHAPVPHYSIPEYLVAAAVAAGAQPLTAADRARVLALAAAGCAGELASAQKRGFDRPARPRKGQENLFETSPHNP